MSTLAMGKEGEWAVDQDFRLRGIEGVRVVDLSACPILTNNHTEVNAYVIGEVAARKIIEEIGGAVTNGFKLNISREYVIDVVVYYHIVHYRRIRWIQSSRFLLLDFASKSGINAIRI
jgi:hypothetical protein